MVSRYYLSRDERLEYAEPFRERDHERLASARARRMLLVHHAEQLLGTAFGMHRGHHNARGG